VTGNVTLARQRDVAQLNLSARSRRLDLADTLPQLGASVPIRGGLEDVTVTVNGRGRTLRTLSRQTALSLETRGGGITLEDAQGVPISTFELAEASLKAGAGQRAGMTLDGSFRDVPLKLIVETARLETLATAVSQPWPLEVSLQGRQFNLSATGSVAQPFRARGFELTFDMTGPDPSGVDSLLNFAIPLRGEYRIRGRFTDDASHYRLTDLEATIGQSDIRGSIAILMDDVRPWVSAGLSSRVVNIEDLRPSEAADERAARVLPQYVIPVEALASTDLNFNFTAGQVSLHGNRLGNLAIRARNHGGVLVSSAQVTGLRTGARLTVEIQVNVNQNPPANRIALTARSVDYGQLLMDARMARSAQGRLDAEIDLAGPGASLRDFLNRAEGQVRVQGGSGSIQSRELELWTSGLMRAMLPEGLGRESTVRLNCIVGHIDVTGGVAKTDKLLVDTARVTIAGSGALNLGTERVDLLLSPNPRQARLVSFANPVRVTGTLTAPVVEVTKLPRLEFAATTGLLASLVNPAFLLLAFGDIGGGADNPCIAAIDRREAVAGAGRLPGEVLQRFRNLFFSR
jgi:uncharacterized protein involved in outer membrane biogenesis